MNAPLTVGSVAELVRSKNAGPFWQTLDVFFSNDENYRAVAESAALNADSIAALYRIDPDTIHIYRLPEIRVVKISFPRPTVQGGRSDRDMHAGQQHVPLSQLVLTPPERARIGLLWRGERGPGASPTRGDTFLVPLFDALTQLDVVAQKVVYSDDAREEVGEELRQLDGILVWVNPIQDGHDRTHLDALLREAAARGTWVSAHPDTILRMGTKEVLFRTRNLGWGTDTDLYETEADFRTRFPARLAADHVRVLKQLRGNGGQGVWKVELVDRSAGSDASLRSIVQVQHAVQRDGLTDEMPLGEFLDSCAEYFSDAGRLIDQEFQGRLAEGLIRCYLVRDEVVGFCHQSPKGFAPPTTASVDAAATGVRHVMEPPSTPAYRALRAKVEGEWVPQMMELLELDVASMPVIWDADFLYGPKTATGEDTYVLCEINVSAVWPYPEVANGTLAEAAVAATIATRPRTQQSNI